MKTQLWKLEILNKRPNLIWQSIMRFNVHPCIISIDYSFSTKFISVLCCQRWPHKRYLGSPQKTMQVVWHKRQGRLPTMYWPKLHKRPYKARFIANSSSCTTTELSKLLTSCLTAVKNHVIRYCEKVYERSGTNLFWSIKNSGEVLNKLKSRGFHATSLSTYDFSTLYTTLPHNLIKETLINLIEWTFEREGSLYIAYNERQAFFTSGDSKRYKLWSCQTCVKP